MPVDFVQLAARLDTSMVTKPTMTGFGICNLKMKTEPLSAEVLEMIGNFLFYDELIHQQERWTRISTCGQQRCATFGRSNDMSEDDPRIDWHWTMRDWYQFGCPEAQHLFEERWFAEGGNLLAEFDGYCADDDASFQDVLDEFWLETDWIFGHRDMCQEYAAIWKSTMSPTGMARFNRIPQKDFNLSLHVTLHDISGFVDIHFQRFWNGI